MGDLAMLSARVTPVRLSLVIAIAFAGLAGLVIWQPDWWKTWGSLVVAFIIAAATVILVAVTTRYVVLTDRLASITERQGALVTLPVIALSSSERKGKVTIKSRGAPALNVEFRIVQEIGGILEPEAWQWVDAIMARGADKEKDRPGGVTVHGQVRFVDRLGTTFLVERRKLGTSAVDAYRVFRLEGLNWEHLSWTGSAQKPLEADSAVPEQIIDTGHPLQ
jgi:hypothetical protein